MGRDSPLAMMVCTNPISRSRLLQRAAADRFENRDDDVMEPVLAILPLNPPRQMMPRQDLHCIVHKVCNTGCSRPLRIRSTRVRRAVARKRLAFEANSSD